MTWMSGDLLDSGYEDSILLIEGDSIKGFVEGKKWKEDLNPKSTLVRKYGFSELADKLKAYVKKNGPLPKEGLLFSEKAKRFL